MIRALAVVGAMALIMVLITGIAWWRVSVPASDAARSPTPGGSGSVPDPATLNSGDVYADGTSMSADRFVTSSGDVRDVRAVARGLSTTGGKVAATFVGIDATVPFATVQRQIGHDVQLTHDGSGRVRAQAPITFLGRTVQASAVADVVPEGRELVIRPVSIDVPGPDALSGALLAVTARALTLREEVPGLPEGMRIATLTVRDDGFMVHLSGSNISLSR